MTSSGVTKLGWKGNEVVAETNLTGVIELSVDTESYPRNRIVKKGSRLIDVTNATGWTKSGAGNVFSVTPEWSRRSANSLKIDMMSASADAIVEWSNATGITVDPVDKLLAFDLYIPELVNTDTVGGISINIFLSNTTSYSAPGTTFILNSNYLRQGVNEIRLCGKDADGALGSYRGTGTLPHGMSKAGAGGGSNPLNWANPIKYISIQISRVASNPRIFYMDEIRIPDKIKPFFCLGFDASGSTQTDDIFLTRTAPFLKANNIPCYFTTTIDYDGAFWGTQDDLRKGTLYSDYKWDAINHSWSHGAGSAGKIFSSGNSLVVSGGGTLATLTLGSAHLWTLGTPLLLAVAGATGASAAGCNGVQLVTPTTTNAVTFPITGGADGTATGTIKAGTRFSDVLNSVAQTNQPIVLSAQKLSALMKHEIRGVKNYPLARGWLRGQEFMAYPNNSPPDMRLMEPEAAAAGIKLARGSNGTTCRVSTFGVDNPLNLPSTDLSSGSVYGSTITDITNALQGALNRGEGLFVFGHYLRDEALDAVVDINSPPGMNGNPPAPGSSSTELWWYAGQLEKLLTTVVIPKRDAGELDFLSASNCVDVLTTI